MGKTRLALKFSHGEAGGGGGGGGGLVRNFFKDVKKNTKVKKKRLPLKFS